MNNIQITKIDDEEFVTLTDYLRLKEEKQELEYLGDINEDLRKDNEELRKDNQELKGLVDLNRELRKENKELKDRIEEIEKYKMGQREEIRENILNDNIKIEGNDL